MRNALVALWILLCSIASAAAQIGVGIALPGISIGIDVPTYPQLVPVPGYPVYYAPQVNSNYFFYDGMYWIYQRDNWYASSWYNGPWSLVGPDVVPLFVLRVPVQYYRQAPVYFRGWRSDAPPRWGEHWGNSWQQSHGGWDNWDRRAAYAPAPLPVYQRQYSGNRYPVAAQQQVIQTQNYRYQPHDAVVQQHFQAQQVQSAPAASPQGRPAATQAPVPAPRAAIPQPAPAPQAAAPIQRAPPGQMGSAEAPKPVAAKPPPQQSVTIAPHSPPPQQVAVPRQPPPARMQGQENGPQARMNVQESKPQRPQQQAQQVQQVQQVQQAAAPHAQPMPKAQVKVPPQEARQSQEKVREKGEPKGAEANK